MVLSLTVIIWSPGNLRITLSTAVWKWATTEGGSWSRFQEKLKDIYLAWRAEEETKSCWSWGGDRLLFCWLKTKRPVLYRSSRQTSCKGADKKSFRLWKPYGFSYSYLTLSLWYKSGHDQHANELDCRCPNKALFIQTGAGSCLSTGNSVLIPV